MARRIPKFPLKMANGANVRSIEELRENADIEDIVNYFLNGQLGLWFRAFGYVDISQSFEKINIEMIQNVCNTLAIPINEMKIRKYVTEKTAQMDNSTENSIEVDLSKIVEIDYDELRKKLCHINDIDNILTNFVIEVILVLDENGITGNYRVDLMEKKMKQYISFVSPYHTKKEENSLEHLYQNIAFSIDNLATRLLMVETNSVIEKSSYFLFSNHQNGYFNNPD